MNTFNEFNVGMTVSLKSYPDILMTVKYCKKIDNQVGVNWIDSESHLQFAEFDYRQLFIK